MMLGLGVGGWAAGLFHLLTHAFFKALLFLGAGSVYHSVHTYEMPALGGLLKKMPITAYTMLVGTLAISGVPFFSGFYSKDAILAAAIARRLAEPRALPALPAAGRRGDDHGLLHVPDVVPDLRRRAAGLPVASRGPGRRTSRTRSTPWPSTSRPRPRARPPRPEPGRPRPRERADDDLAADRPGGLSVFVGWTWWIGLPVGTPVLEKMLDYGEPADVIDAHWAHWYAAGLLAGHRRGRDRPGSLYYAPATCPTSCRPGSAPRGPPSGSAASTCCSRTSGTSTTSTSALFVRPCLAFARLLRRVRQVPDRRHGQRLGLRDRAAEPSGRRSSTRSASTGWSTSWARWSTCAGDWSRAIQTGKLRNYLMFLAVALVGLFAGVFAWISR